MTTRHEKASATWRARVQAEILRKTKLFLAERSPLALTHRILSPHVGFTEKTVRRHFPDIGDLILQAYRQELSEACSPSEQNSPREALTNLIMRLATAFIRHPSLTDGMSMELEKAASKQSPLYRAVRNDLGRRIVTFRREKRPEAGCSRQENDICLSAIVTWARKYELHCKTPDPDVIEAFAHRTVTTLGG